MLLFVFSFRAMKLIIDVSVTFTGTQKDFPKQSAHYFWTISWTKQNTVALFKIMFVFNS